MAVVNKKWFLYLRNFQCCTATNHNVRWNLCSIGGINNLILELRGWKIHFGLGELEEEDFMEEVAFSALLSRMRFYQGERG